ncbi:unnamed protein product [Leptosia nina]|uniref:Uncharacterized protein n=1 Tax=Leptosia nina TaxID=320188 RepID=A0AAV1JNQ7_9NEOP
MSVRAKGIFVVAAKRTPFCKYGGAMQMLPASQVFAEAAKDAIRSAKLNPSVIDSTIVGNINFLSQCDGGKTPRYCGIYSGVPIDKPSLGVNKTCGSGLQAIITGAVEILTNSAKACLVGGTEVMSALPMLVRDVRFGTTLNKSYVIEDYIQKPLLDTYTGLSQYDIAEKIAKQRNITREDVDRFAFGSYLKWKAAQDENLFKSEITPIKSILNDKEYIISVDELDETRSNNDIDKAANLGDGNIITDGNSAAPADGAAALILVNDEVVKDQNLKPIAKLSGWACVGADPPNELGAVVAIKRVLDYLNVTIEDIDVFEINETFASETLAVIKDLGIDECKINVNGGALVLGNPVSATGARMATHIVHFVKDWQYKDGNRCFFLRWWSGYSSCF